MAKLCKRKNLKKYADTKNIHDVSNDTSIGVFQNLYDSLIEEGYELYDSKNNYEKGCWGAFCYELPPIGVDKPIIYLLEIYFMFKAGNRISIVVEHRYDTNGNIISSDYHSFPGEFWRDIQDDIMGNSYRTKDGHNVLFTKKETFKDTKDIVNEKIKERNNNYIDAPQ